MKESTKKHIERLHQITNKKCGECAIPYKCCSGVFCELTRLGFEGFGVNFEETGNKDMPFMGENGCVVPPQYRPQCSGYVCPEHLKDRKFRRESQRIHAKLKEDKELQEIIKPAIDVAKVLVEKMIKSGVKI